MRDLTVAPSTLQLWQLKLALAAVLRFKSSSNLLSSETLLALKHEAISTFNELEESLSGAVQTYLSAPNFSCHSSIIKQVSAYVTFYDIPFGIAVNSVDQLLELSLRLQSSGCSPESVAKIMHILGI